MVARAGAVVPEVVRHAARVGDLLGEDFAADFLREFGVRARRVARKRERPRLERFAEPRALRPLAPAVGVVREPPLPVERAVVDAVALLHDVPPGQKRTHAFGGVANSLVGIRASHGDEHPGVRPIAKRAARHAE